MYCLGVYQQDLWCLGSWGGSPTKKVNFHHPPRVSLHPSCILKMWASVALRQKRQMQDSTCIGQWRGCFRFPGSSWGGKSETGLLMAPQQAPWHPAPSGHMGGLRQETMCFNFPLMSPEVALPPTPQPAAGTKGLWQCQSICFLLRWGNQGWREDVLLAGSNSSQVWDFFPPKRMWMLGIMIEGLVHKQAPTAELHPVPGLGFKSAYS